MKMGFTPREAYTTATLVLRKVVSGALRPVLDAPVSAQSAPFRVCFSVCAFVLY
jgi:hypothetical protein